MKRIGIVLACLAAWLWATPASAQFKWGLEAGVNMSKILSRCNLTGCMANKGLVNVLRFNAGTIVYNL